MKFKVDETFMKNRSRIAIFNAKNLLNEWKYFIETDDWAIFQIPNKFFEPIPTAKHYLDWKIRLTDNGQQSMSNK